MQHRGHPPGKALGLPDAPQADCRVAFEQLHAAFAVDLEQDAVQRADVAGGQVEALGAGRRDDVRGITEQKQAAVLHRFDDEAA